MTEPVTEVAYLLDWNAAELAAAAHMKQIGFIDAATTGSGVDGGIDVQSSDAAAQVKFYASPVGRPDIQRLRGAAHAYRLALFYSTGGYTQEAIDYANSSGVALFTMDPYGRCQPCSDSSAILVEAGLVDERRARLEALQAAQYAYAVSAVKASLSLFQEFAGEAELGPDEAPLYSHVVAGLADLVVEFHEAVESRRFGEADERFQQCLTSLDFLSWTSGPGLRVYSTLDEAVAEGWRRDADSGAPDLLYRAASQVFELQELINKDLEAWQEHFPAGLRLSALISAETARLAGMLLTVSVSDGLLSSESVGKLVGAVQVGVDIGYGNAKKTYAHITRLLRDAGLDARDLVSRRLRGDSIVDSITRQLKVGGPGATG